MLKSSGKRIKDIEFNTQVKDIQVSYFDSMEEPISSVNNLQHVEGCQYFVVQYGRTYFFCK